MENYFVTYKTIESLITRPKIDIWVNFIIFLIFIFIIFVSDSVLIFLMLSDFRLFPSICRFL
jgi:hypothetical protein